MNRFRPPFPVLAIGVLLPLPAFGQSVDWSGEIRLRSEVDNRNFDLDSRPNTYSLLRTRVGIHPQVEGFLQLQDSRVLGESGNTLAALNNVDLHQAYVEVRLVILSQRGGWRSR